MRRFNWRLFRRKGKKKVEEKDEKLLIKNVKEIKEEIMGDKRKDMHEVAKELLSEDS